MPNSLLEELVFADIKHVLAEQDQGLESFLSPCVQCIHKPGTSECLTACMISTEKDLTNGKGVKISRL
jgi:hypothetical protein